MGKRKSKFFFNEINTTPEKQPKVKKVKNKEPKPIKNKEKIRSNSKGLSFYGEKINYFIKNWLIVIILIIAVVILILFVKGCNDNKSKKVKTPNEINNSEPVIVESISININQDVPSIDEFVKNYSKVKNETDTIKYEDTNFANNKYNAVGSYKVTITLNGKEYTSKILVIDKEPPVFALKDVTITEGDYYAINDFVTSCSDNSGKECVINYEFPEYGKLSSPGTYNIGIVATDLSGNAAATQKAKLVINAKAVSPTPSKPKNKTCEFGSTEYTSDHVITYSLIKNNCPIDASYAKTDTYITIPDQMAKKEYDKLYQEIQNKNVSMLIQFSRTVIPVLNNEKTGLVGYAAYITADEVEKTSSGKVKKIRTVVSFDINPNGTRKYTVNELGL